jgi:hypothetical protein
MIGRADGALAGYFPQPAIGNPAAYGPSVYDDFLWVGSSTVRPGKLQWVQTTIGSLPTYTDQVGTNVDIGIRQISTAVTINTGGLLRSNGFIFAGPPALGAEWEAKIRQSGTAAGTTIWSGFGSALSAPLTAVASSFLGIRCQGAANVFGVVKNGAASETTIDLGVTADAWRIFGFEVVDTGSGVVGIQFFWRDATSRFKSVRTNVGTPITANMPSINMYWQAMGTINTVGASRQGQIDFWSLGGRTARQ